MKEFEVTFRIELPDYLRQWLIFVMGGVTPVRFPKGSPFSSFLRVFLRNKREREDFVQISPSSVDIVIPKFPGKDPKYDNYLPARARKDLEGLVRDAFDARLFAEVVSLRNVGRRINDIVMTWMDENGIECTDRNYESVIKRLKILRARENDRIRKRLAYQRKKKQ